MAGLGFWSFSQVPEYVRPRNAVCIQMHEITVWHDSTMTNKNFEVLKSPAGCQCPQTLPLVLEKQFAWKDVGNRNNSSRIYNGNIWTEIK